MGLPYSRKFTLGRQSELLYGEELHKNFESTKHLLDKPEDGTEPQPQLDGALWLKRTEQDNELKTFNKATHKFENVFKRKFQITDHITSVSPPQNPVPGQLWIYQGVMCWYTGSDWTPVKALIQDESQFSLAIFQDYQMVTPMNKIGSTVVHDEDIDNFKKARRQYLQRKIDVEHDSEYGADGTKWEIGTEYQYDSPVLADKVMGVEQFIVPNLTVDRIFLNDRLDNNYTQQSQICIEYPKNVVANRTPSLIHMNPGKLTNIIKRLIKVDLTNPVIQIPTQNTEFYGFTIGHPEGHFLRPEIEQDDGGYIDMGDSIILSKEQSSCYNYVLAITFEFTWMRSSGILRRRNNRASSSSYTIQDYAGPINVFIDGFNLEPNQYSEDNLSETISINADTSNREIATMRSDKREFGYVRFVDLQNRAVVETMNAYESPLVFMNGQAMNAAVGDVSFEGHFFYVPNGQENMVWSIVELKDKKTGYDMMESAGTVSQTDKNGNAYIEYDKKNDVPEDLILFVDGLLIKKGDLVIDEKKGTVTTAGLAVDQDYILLRDKNHNFYPESNLLPALEVDKLSESLVYDNGYLLCNDSAIAAKASSLTKYATIHNQIAVFLKEDPAGPLDGTFRRYDIHEGTWIDMTPQEIKDVLTVACSYQNTTASVSFNIPIDKAKDYIEIYAYCYASDIEHVLTIKNYPKDYVPEFKQKKMLEYTELGRYGKNDLLQIAHALYPEMLMSDLKAMPLSDLVKYTDMPYIMQEKTFMTGGNAYEAGKGSIAVYVNGIRQYNVYEMSDGFELPENVTGNVTFVIEYPEDGNENTGKQVVLDETNLVPNMINVYKTDKVSFYPGRIAVYVDGLRQSQKTYSVLDNHTIIFTGSTQLIGNHNNYPKEIIYDAAGRVSEMYHTNTDKILVEVKANTEWHEDTIELHWPKDGTANFASMYEIPVGNGTDVSADILETQDEVLIYIDGLFMGLKRDQGYQLDKSKGVIRIIDSEVVNRLVTDPLFTYLKEHPGAMTAYKEKHGKEYVPAKKTIILEWR